MWGFRPGTGPDRPTGKPGKRSETALLERAPNAPTEVVEAQKQERPGPARAGEGRAEPGPVGLPGGAGARVCRGRRAAGRRSI